MPANHCKPHTKEAKRKMSLAKIGKPTKWNLPELEIVDKLLNGSETRRSIAAEFGCSDSTIGYIFRKHTTKEQRLAAKTRKQSAKLRGRKNPTLKSWREKNDVWTGRKHTKIARERQSRSHIGKSVKMITRIKNSARLQGISELEWTEFASSKMDRMRKSKEWAEWRNAVFSRDNYTCQECRKQGGELHPHHIKPKSISPELMFEVSNGTTLCSLCHRKTDSYGKNHRGRKT